MEKSTQRFSVLRPNNDPLIICILSMLQIPKVEFQILANCEVSPEVKMIMWGLYDKELFTSFLAS